MPPISDLVRDSKLETTFSDKYTQHVYHVSGATPRQRKVRKEERWQREKHLGTGAFGSVWLEKFITENGEVQHRAVKEIRKGAQKSKAIDYSRELEAIAKFSHPKVREPFFTRFLISFGSIAFLARRSYQKLMKEIV
jgi:Protein tyrosine and serine/threonine kinase